MTTRMERWIRAAWFSLVGLAWSGLALAQQAQGTQSTQSTTQSAPSTTTSTTSSTWLTGDWWMWAIGVAVFLIIVIALTTRSSRNA